ncbi:MAG TPA: hypothetical protein VLM40_15320 [Gemmata sp.]|nr:hypothetical protein [Gemmata sp.]
MFVATTALILLSGPTGELIKNSLNLELKLDVIEAFEHGPVILDVTITNRGKTPLKLARGQGEIESTFVLPQPWRAWSPPPVFLPAALIIPTLKPGDSLTERHNLHIDYVSSFPAGKYEIEVSWVLHGLAPASNELPIIAVPTKRFPIRVSPATRATRFGLVWRLKKEYDALPPTAGEQYGDSLFLFCNKIRNTPHRELIPLALQIMKRVERNPLWELRDSMEDFLFRADPHLAHGIFVDWLLTTPPRPNAVEVFSDWQRAEREFPDIFQSYFERISERPYEEMVNYDVGLYWLDPMNWGCLWPGEEVWSLTMWLNFTSPRVLPKEELRRLSKAKDIEVRANTYCAFGHRLGKQWCDEFLKEAREFAKAKTNPRIRNPEDLPL